MMQPVRRRICEDDQNKSLFATDFAAAAFIISSVCAGITGIGAPLVVPIESHGVAAAAAGGASCEIATSAGAGAASTVSQGVGGASARIDAGAGEGAGSGSG